MLVGVELLANSFDRLESMTLKGRSQLTIDEQHSVDPGQSPQGGSESSERPLQIVQDRKQVMHERSLGELGELFPLLLTSPPVVNKISLGSLPTAQLLFVQRVRLSKSAPQHLDGFFLEQFIRWTCAGRGLFVAIHGALCSTCVLFH